MKKLNGFFMYKEILSGGKLLWNINHLLNSSLAAFLASPTLKKKKKAA